MVYHAVNEYDIRTIQEQLDYLDIRTTMTNTDAVNTNKLGIKNVYLIIKIR